MREGYSELIERFYCRTKRGCEFVEMLVVISEPEVIPFWWIAAIQEMALVDKVWNGHHSAANCVGTLFDVYYYEGFLSWRVFKTVLFRSVLEDDDICVVAKLLGDLMAYRASGTGRLKLIAGLSLLQKSKLSTVIPKEQTEAPQDRLE